MVRGLDIFENHFKDFPYNYIIIGGTACDILIGQEGLNPRATKDIDIILIVEAIEPSFVQKFWDFVKEGNYERKEKDEGGRKYYRFINPENTLFPFQLELFSRNPDLIDLDVNTHLTPIPVDDDLSSLSAILLDEDYYHFLKTHSSIVDNVNIANIESLICMKARAFLDMMERKAKGEKVNERHIKKHKSDVFRLAVLLAERDVFDLPIKIKKDLQAFIDLVTKNIPDKLIFKSMGLSGIKPIDVYKQLKLSFKLN
ncbi:MAG: hypothetical protein P1P88_19120 [Bacteroidales bacterium]|nr:hypothetical protein [Bacteroidales bacterium]